MDFLERIFSFFPDGDSATEILVLSVIACGLVALLLWIFRVRYVIKRTSYRGLNRYGVRC